MFRRLTNNWRDHTLLLSRQIAANPIGSVMTQAGLRIRAELDENTYQAGIKIADEALVGVSIERDEFHGGWNLEIKPRRRRREF